jgi:hypothetical protein
MSIKELKQPSNSLNKKAAHSFLQLQKFLNELRTKELKSKAVNQVNQEIDKVNSLLKSDKNLRKHLNKSQTLIIKIVEKEHKLVAKNHYRNMWLALGMAAFGIPLGVVFGASMGNMAFIGIGLPIGMALGIAVGTRMDKKALEEGRQLDFEMKP